MRPDPHQAFLKRKVLVVGSTGWLTSWGEAIQNTSADSLIAGLSSILAAAGGTGSVNLYMAHGGTSFGFAAGPLTKSRSSRLKHLPDLSCMMMEC